MLLSRTNSMDQLYRLNVNVILKEIRLTTLCIDGRGQCAPLTPPELLHLNQASVQDFISNPTNTHASSL